MFCKLCSEDKISETRLKKQEELPLIQDGGLCCQQYRCKTPEEVGWSWAGNDYYFHHFGKFKGMIFGKTSAQPHTFIVYACTCFHSIHSMRSLNA